jgi:predicted Zn-dependent protease
MKRTILSDLALMVAIFGGMLAVAIAIPWQKEEKKIISAETELKIGDRILRYLQENDPDFKDLDVPVVDSALTAIHSRLENGLDEKRYEYKLEVFDNDMVNAFALPGGIILISRGMIDFTESPEELAAVIAHEMAHVEKSHSLNRMVKNLSLQLLLSDNKMVIAEVAKMVSSTTYDRKQEREADLFAMELLEKTKTDPRILGTFFSRLTEEENKLPEVFRFISSHPDLKERVVYCLEYEPSEDFMESKIDLDWAKIKSCVKLSAEE